MTVPMIPVSWGELLDRVTILEIKLHRLRAGCARARVTHEQALMRQSTTIPSGIAELEAGLLAVNTRLWRIEDLIREKEAAGDFGVGFIRLARAVYHENDERGRIKHAVNRRLRSVLVEEKQYSRYGKLSAAGEKAESVKGAVS